MFVCVFLVILDELVCYLLQPHSQGSSSIAVVKYVEKRLNLKSSSSFAVTLDTRDDVGSLETAYTFFPSFCYCN